MPPPSRPIVFLSDFGLSALQGLGLATGDAVWISAPSAG
jgi:hypothetical protein